MSKMLTWCTTFWQVTAIYLYYASIPTCILAGLLILIRGAIQGSWTGIVGGTLLLWFGGAGSRSILGGAKTRQSVEGLRSLVNLAALANAKGKEN